MEKKYVVPCYSRMGKFMLAPPPNKRSTEKSILQQIFVVNLLFFFVDLSDAGLARQRGEV